MMRPDRGPEAPSEGGPRVTLAGTVESIWQDLLAHSPQNEAQSALRRALGIAGAVAAGSAFHMMLVHRVGHVLHRWGLAPFSFLGEKLIYHLYHCVIPSSAEIGPGVWFPHPIGIVMAQGTRVGRRCYVFQHVQLISTASRPGRIEIGDRASLMAGAMVVGSTVGAESTIGAGAVVTRPVPARSIAVGVPARFRPLRHDEEGLVAADRPGGPPGLALLE